MNTNKMKIIDDVKEDVVFLVDDHQHNHNIKKEEYIQDPDIKEIHLMFCLSKGITMKRDKIRADEIFSRLLIAKNPLVEFIYLRGGDNNPQIARFIYSGGRKNDKIYSGSPVILHINQHHIREFCEQKAVDERKGSMGYYSYIYAKYGQIHPKEKTIYYEKAIKRGNICPYYELGKNGYSRVKHRFQFYENGAEKGDSRCMYKFGRILLDNCLEASSREEKRWQIIFDLFEKAANFLEHNSIRAFIEILVHHKDLIKVDTEKVIQLAELGCSISDYSCAIFLSDIYNKDYHNLGIQESNEKTFYYINKAYIIETDCTIKGPCLLFKYAKKKIKKFLKGRLIEWRPEYHNVFANFLSFEKDTVLYLLLISKNRSSSSKNNISFLVKGIAMKIIFFYCNLEWEIKKKQKIN